MCLITSLCYIRKEGSYLMLYRDKKQNDLNEGKWVGVGGKLEKGETIDQCLVREVKEETGLTLTGYDFRGVITFVSDQWETEYMFLYEGTSFEGELTNSCNEGELAWVKKEDVLSLRTWEGDRLFLEPLIESSQQIFMTVVYEGDRLVNCVQESETEMLQRLLSDS